MNLEEKVKDAIVSKTFQITDSCELDGILYEFVAYLWPECQEVTWDLIPTHELGAPRAHAGQQQMIGFHGDSDFEEHENCPSCTSSEESWICTEELWEYALRTNKVEWDPRSYI